MPPSGAGHRGHLNRSLRSLWEFSDSGTAVWRSPRFGGTYVQVSPAHSCGFSFANARCNSQPRQMPNALSMNSIDRQMLQSARVMPLLTLRNPITPQEMNAMTRPIDQASFFCAAPTHSGLWARTSSDPTMRLGVYLVPTKRRKVMSNMKIAPNMRSG